MVFRAVAAVVARDYFAINSTSMESKAECRGKREGKIKCACHSLSVACLLDLKALFCYASSVGLVEAAAAAPAAPPPPPPVHTFENVIF
ncbi:hypothetical protein T4E_6961 [Trichinella pseudospiralis]|uniref:Uncharacterized protein n=1 Tax=Trichinella pseudospiralis TaxID=6337 RepID=A0A0V0Y0N6_TRIPS|nr:hypothetical protein T4E_6961 [Trichinella pseudospiralis]